MLLIHFRKGLKFLLIGLGVNLVLCGVITICSNVNLSAQGWQTTLTIGRTEYEPHRAWLFWRLDKPGMTAMSFTPTRYPVEAPERYDENGYEFRPDLLPSWSRIDRYSRPTPSPIHGIFVQSVGWPWRSLSALEINNKAVIDSEDGGVMYSSDAGPLIPLRPVWSGMFGNTFMFGFSLWGLVALRSFIKGRMDLDKSIPVTYSFGESRQRIHSESVESSELKKAA